MMVLMFAGTLILSAVPVWAKKPITMTIDVTPITGGPTNVVVLKNGLMKISFWVEQDWDGDWVGDNAMSGSTVVRTPDRGHSLNTVMTFGTFEGTVYFPDGTERTGTVMYRMRNNFVIENGVPSNFFSNVITILQGTGELANIHGQGTVDEPSPGQGEIIINVHFDP